MFFPIPVDLDVRAEAEESWDWRIRIRDAVLPQVPHYLLLGKGLAMTHEELDYSLAQSAGTMGTTSADQIGLALAGDYHNGPLSIVIPFGIWGVATFLWFLTAGLRVLYRNYKYGDESLRIVNSVCLPCLWGRRWCSSSSRVD